MSVPTTFYSLGLFLAGTYTVYAQDATDTTITHTSGLINYIVDYLASEGTTDVSTYKENFKLINKDKQTLFSKTLTSFTPLLLLQQYLPLKAKAYCFICLSDCQIKVYFYQT